MFWSQSADAKGEDDTKAGRFSTSTVGTGMEDDDSANNVSAMSSVEDEDPTDATADGWTVAVVVVLPRAVVAVVVAETVAAGDEGWSPPFEPVPPYAFLYSKTSWVRFAWV